MKAIKIVCSKCNELMLFWTDGINSGTYCLNCGYQEKNGVIMANTFLDYTEAYQEELEKFPIDKCAICETLIPKRIELIVQAIDSPVEVSLIEAGDVQYDKFLCPCCISSEIINIKKRFFNIETEINPLITFNEIYKLLNHVWRKLPLTVNIKVFKEQDKDFLERYSKAVNNFREKFEDVIRKILEIKKRFGG